MDVQENEPQEPSWRVRYTLTDADLTAFRRFDMKRRRIGRTTAVMIVIAFLLMFFLFLMEIPSLGLVGVTLVSLVIALVALAAGIGLGSFGMHRLLKKASREAGEITLEFFPDRLAGTNTHYRTEYRWRSFADIVRGANATYYYFSRTQAIIVPDRVFPAPDEAAACAEFAAERWRSLSAEPPRATASPSPFTITFAMDDATTVHQAYSRAGRRRWIRQRLAHILISSVAVIFLIWASIQAVFQTGAPIWEMAAPLVIAALILAQLYWGYAPAQIVRRIRKMGGSEPRTARLEPDGMTLINSTSASQIPWKSVKRVEEDGKLVYIDLENGAWFTIPVAAFLDLDHHKTFVDAIGAYREGRQHTEPAGASWPPAPET